MGEALSFTDLILCMSLAVDEECSLARGSDEALPVFPLGEGGWQDASSKPCPWCRAVRFTRVRSHLGNTFPGWALSFVSLSFTSGPCVTLTNTRGCFRSVFKTAPCAPYWYYHLCVTDENTEAWRQWLRGREEEGPWFPHARCGS